MSTDLHSTGTIDAPAPSVKEAATEALQATMTELHDKLDSVDPPFAQAVQDRLKNALNYTVPLSFNGVIRADSIVDLYNHTNYITNLLPIVSEPSQQEFLQTMQSTFTSILEAHPQYADFKASKESHETKQQEFFFTAVYGAIGGIVLIKSAIDASNGNYATAAIEAGIGVGLIGLHKYLDPINAHTEQTKFIADETFKKSAENLQIGGETWVSAFTYALENKLDSIRAFTADDSEIDETIKEQIKNLDPVGQRQFNYVLEQIHGLKNESAIETAMQWMNAHTEQTKFIADETFKKSAENLQIGGETWVTALTYARENDIHSIHAFTADDSEVDDTIKEQIKVLDPVGQRQFYYVLEQIHGLKNESAIETAMQWIKHNKFDIKK